MSSCGAIYAPQALKNPSKFLGKKRKGSVEYSTNCEGKKAGGRGGGKKPQ